MYIAVAIVNKLMTYQRCTCNPWSSKPTPSFDQTRLHNELDTCRHHPISQCLLQPQQVPSLSPGDQMNKRCVVESTRGGWGRPHVTVETSLCWHHYYKQHYTTSYLIRVKQHNYYIIVVMSVSITYLDCDLTASLELPHQSSACCLYRVLNSSIVTLLWQQWSLTPYSLLSAPWLQLDWEEWVYWLYSLAGIFGLISIPSPLTYHSHPGNSIAHVTAKWYTKQLHVLYPQKIDSIIIIW